MWLHVIIFPTYICPLSYRDFYLILKYPGFTVESYVSIDERSSTQSAALQHSNVGADDEVIETCWVAYNSKD